MSAKPNPGPSVSSKSNNARNRRGGRKTATTNQEVVLSVEGEEVPGPSKRPQNSRSKIAPTPKRAPPSHASLVSGGTGHDLGTTGRRNHSSGANGSNTSTSAENSRAYRNSHAYAVSQQPLFTSWNLPDYLAHLEPMLPTGVPRPLEVRGSGIGAGGRESMERTMERGVKVKWPSKRMSVGDMNKRVRALVEWVGREQASALDRDRRREALEKAFMQGTRADQSRGSTGSISRGANDVYEVEGVDSPAVERISVDLHEIAIGDGGYGHKPRSSTMKMMEELMEELILFQERFGPGAKSKERERRLIS
ncbi:hypothetical protein SERLADRAFT_465242 [Serpula lacrymans var. lacrymans S7.9]|nr:uncharacterized protein SERLADRAFT_465242 [Serpula lacrymans var. lacrymans S7.9]EGO25303.1 hypothetical protein SERLADRAFT_465242 [Serpula lacrymans var. lacrymans S7.9]